MFQAILFSFGSPIEQNFYLKLLSVFLTELQLRSEQLGSDLQTTSYLTKNFLPAQ